MTGARLTTLTRLGFAARGLLYLVIGLLVIRAGRSESPSGALEYLASGGGQWLLMVMAAGFIAYGVWRLSDAFFNIEGHRSDSEGKRERVGAAGSGIVHLIFAWQAIGLLRGVRSGSGDGTSEGARVAMDIPGGDLALILAGIALFAVAVYQLIKAAKAKFLRHLDPTCASQPWVKWIGRFGYAARGLVFLISGTFLLKAGLVGEAGETKGFDKALAWLNHPWDLIVAAGLFSFGVYSLIEARFRIIHDVPVDRLRHAAEGQFS